MPNVLWIDDDIAILSGLEAYLCRDIPNIRLLCASTRGLGADYLDTETIELLLFDMVLMEDGQTSSLHRRMGLHLARHALDRGVRRFIAYTVLSASEVGAAWRNILEEAQIDPNEMSFAHFTKGEASVSEVVACAAEMLGSYHPVGGR